MNRRKGRYALAYFSLIVALVLQTTLVKEIAIFGISPMLVLVLVVCFSLMNDSIPSAIFAVIAGLLLDVAGNRAFGLNALMMMYLSLGVSTVGREFFQDTSRSAIILVFVGTLLYETVYFICNFLIFGSGHFWYMLWRVTLVEAVYNAILTILVYYYCNKFLKLVVSRSLLD
ncbi:MAG: rod shape-determining protein MreD [Clostridia bacterium]|nr:rod shape-determining protein MreD [Clostridia bacterium]